MTLPAHAEPAPRKRRPRTNPSADPPAGRSKRWPATQLPPVPVEAAAARDDSAPGREGGRDAVTIYDVAREAAVSIATVSHALNRPERLRQETLGRVLQVVDDLGFVPKSAAVDAARRGVRRIGVVAPFTSYESYLTRLLGVVSALEGRALDVVVYDHPSAAGSTSPLLRSVPMAGRLDGLIIMGLPVDPELSRRLRQRGVATVLVDTTSPGFSAINVDDRSGGYLLGEHLAARGYQDFAFVSEGQTSTDYTSAGMLRLQGFCAALSDVGVRPDSIRHVITGSTISAGREAAEQILGWPALPDAVVANHDALAVGVLGRFRQAGLRVPEDVAVVGYDGSPLAEALDLTTVRQPFAETGRAAAALLQSALVDPALVAQTVNLVPELLVRSTS